MKKLILFFIISFVVIYMHNDAYAQNCTVAVTPTITTLQETNPGSGDGRVTIGWDAACGNRPTTSTCAATDQNSVVWYVGFYGQNSPAPNGLMAECDVQVSESEDDVGAGGACTNPGVNVQPIASGGDFNGLCLDPKASTCLSSLIGQRIPAGTGDGHTWHVVGADAQGDLGFCDAPPQFIYTLCPGQCYNVVMWEIILDVPTGTGPTPEPGQGNTLPFEGIDDNIACGNGISIVDESPVSSMLQICLSGTNDLIQNPTLTVSSDLGICAAPGPTPYTGTYQLTPEDPGDVNDPCTVQDIDIQTGINEADPTWNGIPDQATGGTGNGGNVGDLSVTLGGCGNSANGDLCLGAHVVEVNCRESLSIAFSSPIGCKGIEYFANDPNAGSGPTYGLPGCTGQPTTTTDGKVYITNNGIPVGPNTGSVYPSCFTETVGTATCTTNGGFNYPADWSAQFGAFINDDGDYGGVQGENCLINLTGNPFAGTGSNPFDLPGVTQYDYGDGVERSVSTVCVRYEDPCDGSKSITCIKFISDASPMDATPTTCNVTCLSGTGTTDDGQIIINNLVGGSADPNSDGNYSDAAPAPGGSYTFTVTGPTSTTFTNTGPGTWESAANLTPGLYTILIQDSAAPNCGSACDIEIITEVLPPPDLQLVPTVANDASCSGPATANINASSTLTSPNGQVVLEDDFGGENFGVPMDGGTLGGTCTSGGGRTVDLVQLVASGLGGGCPNATIGPSSIAEVCFNTAASGATSTGVTGMSVIALLSPDGSYVPLISGGCATNTGSLPCTAFAGVGGCFTGGPQADQGPGTFCFSPSVGTVWPGDVGTGTYGDFGVPGCQFSDLVGENINGTWGLYIQNIDCNFDLPPNFLMNWSITFNDVVCQTQTNITDFCDGNTADEGTTVNEDLDWTSTDDPALSYLTITDVGAGGVNVEFDGVAAVAGGVASGAQVCYNAQAYLPGSNFANTAPCYNGLCCAVDTDVCFTTPPVPAAPAAPAPVVVCEGTPATLSGACAASTACGGAVPNVNWWDTATGPNNDGSTTPITTGGSYTPADTAPGTYTYYISCECGCESVRTPVVLTIEAGATPFDYPDACIADLGGTTIPYPGPAQTSAGTFTISPSGIGVNIDATTGDLDVSGVACSSLQNTYTITFTPTGSTCTVSDNVVITADACPASSTTPSSICSDGTNFAGPLVVECVDCGRTPADGSWWDTATGPNTNGSTTPLGTGLTFDPTSLLTPLTPGDYTFYVDCDCFDCESGRVPVIFTVLESAVPFDYPDFCISDLGSTTVAYPGPAQTASGSFSISPTGTGVTIDATTGDLDVSGLACGGAPASYTVTFTPDAPNNACIQSDVLEITPESCPPSATTDSFVCDDGSNFDGPLTATCADCPGAGAATVTWWDAATGGNQVGTGASFDPIATISPLVAGTYTFYSQCECFGCPGTREAASIDVLESALPFDYVDVCIADLASLIIPYSGSPQPVSGTFTIDPPTPVIIDATTGDIDLSGVPCDTPPTDFTITFTPDAPNTVCTQSDIIEITPQACPPTSTTEAFICVDGSNITGSLEAVCPDCPEGGGISGLRPPADVTWWDAPTGGNQVGTGTTFDPTSLISPFEPGEYTYYVQCGCFDCPSERSPAIYNIYDIPELTLVETICRPADGGDYDAIVTVDLGTWNSILDGVESTYTILPSAGMPVPATISSNGTITIQDVPAMTDITVQVVVAPENRSCLAEIPVEAPVCCPQSVDDFSGSEEQCIDAAAPPTLPSFADIISTIDITGNEIVTWIDVATGLTYTNPNLPPAPVYTENGCNAQTFAYELHVYCAVDPAVDIDGGTYEVTVWPIPTATENTANCEIGVTNDCPYGVSGSGGYVLYDNDNDGNYTDAMPPDVIPDGTVTVNYTVGILGAPQGCALFDSYDAECVCDIAILEIPFDQGHNGGTGPIYYNEGEIDIYNGILPYTYEWDAVGYVRFAQVADDDNTVYPDGDIELNVIWADNAYYSITVTDAVGCQVVATNDPTANVGGMQEIIDISYQEVEGDNCLTRGSGQGEGRVKVYVEHGTPPYEYEWTGPTTWANGMQYYPMGSGAFWTDGNGSVGEEFELVELPYGWYAVTVTDSGIDDYADPRYFDANGNPIIDDDPNTPLPEQKTQGWYWVECVRQGGRGKVDLADAAIKAYPNPFDAVTTIDFSSPVSGQAQIGLYTLDGRQVLQIFNGSLEADEAYSLQFESGPLQSGLYMIQLTAPDGVVKYEKLMLSK